MRRGPATVYLALTLALPAQYGVLRADAAQAVSATQTQDPAVSEAAVRDTLQKYSAALQSLDANAVKKVQPSIPVENLAKAFREMRELKVEIDAVRVLSMDGPILRVSCRVSQTLTPKAGSRQTTTVTRVMRLRRESNNWVIDGFER
jgi:hypothetical protein